MCFYLEYYSDSFHFGELKGESITKNYINYKCLTDEKEACMTSNQATDGTLYEPKANWQKTWLKVY